MSTNNTSIFGNASHFLDTLIFVSQEKGVILQTFFFSMQLQTWMLILLPIIQQRLKKSGSIEDSTGKPLKEESFLKFLTPSCYETRRCEKKLFKQRIHIIRLENQE